MTRTELLAIAKPIPFNTPMVQAIQENRKTETRRVIKPQPPNVPTVQFSKMIDIQTARFSWDCSSALCDRKSKFSIGDILYVRETWCNRPVTSGGHFRINGTYYYKADGDLRPDAWRGNWRPSIHMPKEAARLFLRVTGVRVERLRDILKRSGEVAKEGVPYADEGDIEASGLRFKESWESTIKPADRLQYGWDANPWVWVIKFERVVSE